MGSWCYSEAPTNMVHIGGIPANEEIGVWSDSHLIILRGSISRSNDRPYFLVPIMLGVVGITTKLACDTSTVFTFLSSSPFFYINATIAMICSICLGIFASYDEIRENGLNPIHCHDLPHQTVENSLEASARLGCMICSALLEVSEGGWDSYTKVEIQEESYVSAVTAAQCSRYRLSFRSKGLDSGYGLVRPMSTFNLTRFKVLRTYSIRSCPKTSRC